MISDEGDGGLEKVSQLVEESYKEVRPIVITSQSTAEVIAGR